MGILHQLGAIAIHWVHSWGYFGVFLGMTLESACIPLPSEVIMPFAGYLAFSGSMSLIGVTIAGTLGNIVGSWIAYWVGYRGGRSFLHKFGKYVFFSPRQFSKAEQWFERRGDITVFVSRLLPAIRTFISLPAGIARMPIGKFFIYTAVGSLPWCLALALVGYFLGQNWEHIQSNLHPLTYAVIAAVILLVISWIVRSRNK